MSEPPTVYRRLSLLPVAAGNRGIVASQKRVRLPLGALVLDEKGVDFQLDPSAGDLPSEGEGWLRLVIENDYYRPRSLELRLARSGTVLGCFEIGYGCPFQPFQCAIEARWWPRLAEEGLCLLAGEPGKPDPRIFATPAPAGGEGPEAVRALAPHLLLASGGEDEDPLAALRDSLCSLRSLAPWGWEEGCVLDGLWQLHQAYPENGYIAAIEHRLAAVGVDRATWNPALDPHSIESTLPLAILAQLNREHPALGSGEAFWRDRTRPGGAVLDEMPTTEGSYTVAYPMAVLARQREDERLAEAALRQLRFRSDQLLVDEAVYQRFDDARDGHAFRNWSRGVAWHLLGILRTLDALEGLAEAPDLVDDFQRIARRCARWQRPDGLWPCFLEEPSVLPDTAGSAGIATALAGGIRRGWLDATLGRRLPRTWGALLSHLTVDGLLTGVAQSNKGGEALQRSDFRVSLALGLGLLAQFAVEGRAPGLTPPLPPG